jgi:hypothetical protein
MNRRQLLKLLGLGVIGHTLDVDRLLWVPGAKKIFIPEPRNHVFFSEAQIIAIELERVLPKVKELFERDIYFFQNLKLVGRISNISLPDYDDSGEDET